MFRLKPIRYYFFILYFLFLPLGVFAHSILWDTSHGVPSSSYVPSLFGGYYQDFTATLQAEGFSIQTTSSGYTTTNLSAVDVAVVSNVSAVSSAYTSVEINALTSFVAGGGGLLIMSDTSGTLSNYQAVAGAFGIGFGSAIAGSTPLQTSNFSDHPVFTGQDGGASDDVSSMYMYYALGLTVDGAAQPLAWTTEGDDIVAASVVYGLGRVVVLGDSSLWRSNGSDDFHEADNPQLAVNVFEHLVDATYIPEPVTFLLVAAGSVVLRRKRHH